jgi:iron complex transport system ATP-binding protein
MPETAVDAAVRIAAREVSYSYGAVPALRGVSVEVRAGEMLAIVGANGSGKSTLLRLLIGALPARDGDIVVDGKAIGAWGSAERARRIAYVPQTGSVDFAFSVREVVALGRWPWRGMRGADGQTDDAIIDDALWAADVHHLAERSIPALSGGERQRVLLARALAQGTGTLVLDEPLGAQDLWHQVDLMRMLRGLVAAGRAVVMVTHDLALARRYADRAVVLDGGAVAAVGASHAVLVPGVLAPIYGVGMRVVDGELRIER